MIKIKKNKKTSTTNKYNLNTTPSFFLKESHPRIPGPVRAPGHVVKISSDDEIFGLVNKKEE